MLVSSFTDESFLDASEVTKLIGIISNLNPQRLDVIILLDENDEELAKSFETNMEVLEMIKQQSAVEVRVFTPKEAFQMYTGLGRQATASHTMYRGNFQIADCLNIDVKILYKVVENRPPTIQKFSKLACRDNQSMQSLDKGVVKAQTVYYEDEPGAIKIIPQDQLIKCLKYGRSMVPIPHEIELQMEYKASKCLTVIGFTKMKNIKRSYLVGRASLITPEQETTGTASELAFNALAESLLEEEKVAICRFVVRNGRPPLLVALFPDLRNEVSPVFYMINMPTSEDLREYWFKSLKVSSPQQD